MQMRIEQHIERPLLQRMLDQHDGLLGVTVIATVDQHGAVAAGEHDIVRR